MKLHPDTQFEPNQENITLLVSGYGLKLTGFKLADSGIENCTLMVQTTSGGYVLRVYRQNKKHDNEIRRELDFIAYLENHGIPVALPIANNKGDLLSSLEQNGQRWQAILMPHMPGSHAASYSRELLKNMATTQATMHNLAAAYQLGDAPAELTELRETHFISLIPNREILDPRWQDFISRAANYVVRLDDSLPKGLCHLDFDTGNVLSEAGAITAVLDFDDLAVAPYVLCLAYTLWHVAHKSGLEGVAYYLDAYQKIRSLTEHEKSFITPIMLFRHYIIGCIDLVDGHTDESLLTEYLTLENELLDLL